MAVDATIVTGATNEVNKSIASLSSSFTDAMISISDGDSVTTVGTKLKEDVNTNATALNTAAYQIADAANYFNP